MYVILALATLLLAVIIIFVSLTGVLYPYSLHILCGCAHDPVLSQQLYGLASKHGIPNVARCSQVCLLSAPTPSTYSFIIYL